ncbi:hypothetical protein CPC08DRAFT_776438, partial [Agrocybe pediades]
VHMRYSMDKVGKALSSFTTIKQALAAVRDALVAHMDAYEKCNMLHGDVSIGNIMFYADEGDAVSGCLNDWDLSLSSPVIASGVRQLSRPGTWQFMSIHILQNPTLPEGVSDDVESFLWVVLQLALR